MTTTTTRRSILAGATALATGAAANAVAIAACRAAASAVEAPDARSLAIIAEYEEVITSYAANFVQWASKLRAGKRAMFLRYGADAPPRLFDDEDFIFEDLQRYNRTRSRRLDRELARVGYRPVERAAAVLHQRLDQLDLEIQELPDTFAALRARALSVLREAIPHFHDHSGRLEFYYHDGGDAHRLWASVAEVTGLGPFVEKIEAILEPDATVDAEGDDAEEVLA